MNKFDRIVDSIDKHTDRAIDAGIHIIYSIVFLLIFAWFLHTIAITISERGENVTIPRNQRHYTQGEINKGTRGGPDMDRQGMGIRSFDRQSGAEA